MASLNYKNIISVYNKSSTFFNPQLSPAGRNVYRSIFTHSSPMMFLSHFI